MKDLKYTIPRLGPSSNVQSASKEETTKKADNEGKQKLKLTMKGLRFRKESLIITRRSLKLTNVERLSIVS